MRFVQLKYIGHYLEEERPKPVTQLKKKKGRKKPAQAHKSHGKREKRGEY